MTRPKALGSADWEARGIDFPLFRYEEKRLDRSIVVSIDKWAFHRAFDIFSRKVKKVLETILEGY